PPTTHQPKRRRVMGTTPGTVNVTDATGGYLPHRLQARRRSASAARGNHLFPTVGRLVWAGTQPAPSTPGAAAFRVGGPAATIHFQR
ncbi:hypothetical protein, partial [Roseiflexus sp.]|uniref:hypothetical protein n=1 Tax=Roseiflexus sp. TaxID=2562120 RepID=UPI00398AD0B6